MSADPDSDVLQLFERCLDQPETTREDWLRAQPVSDHVRTAVRRLLATESRLGDFMETAPDIGLDIPALPSPGDRVGNYRLIKAIDSGGMGIVFLARRADDAYEQQVAVKLIQPTQLLAAGKLRDQLIARFEEERAILAQLDHSGIARILDGGTTGPGIPYLVMEYVDGIALTDYCNRHALDVRARLALFGKVCEAVSAAHRHLIVHRDLKPENVLVDADGQPKLLDFGIAKLLDPAVPEPGSRSTTFLAMTPAYASPEQLRLERMTTSSDVYSLGVMLYQLLTGRRPYDLSGLAAAEAERVVCEQTPDPLRKAVAANAPDESTRRRRLAAIGADLERIVAKAMHKEAERRYPSAQALADDLARYLDHRPVSAQADTAAYRISKFLKRHRLASVATSVALIAIVATAAIAVRQAQHAERAAADAREINRFLIDVIGTSDAYTVGSELTLNEALQEATGKIDQRFGSRPDLASGIRLAIGNSLMNRNRLDDAESLLRQALDERIAAFGETDVRTLQVREALAVLQAYQERHDDAVAQLEGVIEQLEANRLTDHPLYATALNDLAYVHLERENYAIALPYTERAVALFEQNGVDVEPFDRASMLSNLAQALDGLDRSREAVVYYERAYEILQALFPDGSPNSAILLNNWALLERNLGDREKSLTLLQASSDMRKRLFKSAHPLVVRGLTNVSRQALELDRIDLAVNAAREADDLAGTIFSAPHEYAVRAATALADALARAHQTEAAMTALQRAEGLLAGLDDPESSVADHARQVRESLCGSTPSAPSCRTRP